MSKIMSPRDETQRFFLTFYSKQWVWLRSNESVINAVFHYAQWLKLRPSITLSKCHDCRQTNHKQVLYLSVVKSTINHVQAQSLSGIRSERDRFGRSTSAGSLAERDWMWARQRRPISFLLSQRQSSNPRNGKKELNGNQFLSKLNEDKWPMW